MKIRICLVKLTTILLHFVFLNLYSAAQSIGQTVALYKLFDEHFCVFVS